MQAWRSRAQVAMSDFSAAAFAASPDIAASAALGWLSGLALQAQAEGRLPRRSEISPRRIGAAALPLVLIMDVEGSPPRFLIRLVGTELVRVSGRDNTGRYFDELAEQHGPASSYYLKVLGAVAAGRQAMTVTANLFYRRQEWQRFRALLVPVADADNRIAQIVTALELPPADEPETAH